MEVKTEDINVQDLIQMKFKQELEDEEVLETKLNFIDDFKRCFKEPDTQTPIENIKCEQRQDSANLENLQVIKCEENIQEEDDLEFMEGNKNVECVFSVKNELKINKTYINDFEDSNFQHQINTEIDIDHVKYEQDTFTDDVVSVDGLTCTQNIANNLEIIEETYGNDGSPSPVIRKYSSNWIKVDGSFKCRICSKKFRDLRRWEVHWNRHVKETHLSCTSCAEGKNNIHKKVTLYNRRVNLCRCELCPQIFSQKAGVQGHMLCGMDEKPFKCEICLNLETDMRSHSGEKPFKCEMCSKHFSHKAALKMHVRTHTGEKPFKCLICSKQFTQQTNLQTHIRTHTGEKPFKCETCSKQFSHKAHLKGHVRSHTGEKPFKCLVCFKQFTWQADLRTHKRVHTGEKPFKCQVCSKQFAVRSNLKMHMRTHTGEKPFKCETCFRHFSHKTSLENHVRTHTKEKPFKCDTCCKLFAKKSILKSHMFTHTGEKPFKCLICSKQFTQKTNLRVHTIIHAGGRAFKCKMCSKRFSQKATLNRHERTHTE